MLNRWLDSLNSCRFYADAPRNYIIHSTTNRIAQTLRRHTLDGHTAYIQYEVCGCIRACARPARYISVYGLLAGSEYPNTDHHVRHRTVWESLYTRVPRRLVCSTYSNIFHLFANYSPGAYSREWIAHACGEEAIRHIAGTHARADKVRERTRARTRPNWPKTN